MAIALNQLVSVVLAGGFGTRIKHLLPDKPKPMAPVAGRPFLEWVVRSLAKQGIQKVLLSTGHLSQVVERYFKEHTIPGVRVECVVEAAPLGTGGGFLNAVRASGAQPPAWLVLNGDSLALADLAPVVAVLSKPSCSGAIVGRFVEDAARYGTLATGSEGELLRFDEKRTGRGIINTGIYLFRHAVIKEFPNQTPLSFEKDVFPALIKRGFQIGMVATEAPFWDIGTPESLPQAESFIRGHSQYFIGG